MKHAAVVIATLVAVNVGLFTAACVADPTIQDTNVDMYVEVTHFHECETNAGPAGPGDAPCVVTGLDQTRYYSDTQECPELRDADHQIAPLCVIFSEWSNQT